MRRTLGRAMAWVRGSLVLVGLITVVAAIVLGGVLFVFARGETETFPGTSAPGSHEWWDKTQAEAQFCTQCHEQIETELAATRAAGTHNPGFVYCLDCHYAGGDHGGHAAVPAMCVDCHANRVTELADGDAHYSILGQLGETDATASWTCKACHTKVSVTMTVTMNPPLPISLGPTYP